MGHTRSPGHSLLTYLLTISCLPKCKCLSVLCPSLPPSPANNAVSHGSRTRWTLLRTGLLLLRSSGAETAAPLDARNTDTDAAHFFHLPHFLFYIIVYSLQIKHQVCTYCRGFVILLLNVIIRDNLMSQSTHSTHHVSSFPCPTLSVR